MVKESVLGVSIVCLVLLGGCVSQEARHALVHISDEDEGPLME